MIGLSVAVVLGTRPEWIKLETVILALANLGVDVTILDTGQHDYSGSERLESLDGVITRRNARRSRDMTRFVSETSEWLVSQLTAMMPSLLVIQGDTLSTLAGAQVAFLKGIPIAHVEAGLRSYNIERPFPEEGIRRIVSQIASLHFCATENARQNLSRSGIDSESIFVVGNTVIDQVASQLQTFRRRERSKSPQSAIVTCHRRESWEKGLAEILDAIQELAVNNSDVEFSIIRHPNPEWEVLARAQRPWTKNVRLVEPLGHGDFLNLVLNARVIITDSGGIQEEAAFLGIPTVLARKETDRPESVEIGATKIAGFDPNMIVSFATEAINGTWRVPPSNIFGSGNAGAMVGRIVLDWHSGKCREAPA